MAATMETKTGRQFLTDENRWTAIVRRDARADGAFFYSVRTTGVYCLPSCASRRARRENVAFHASAHAAEHAGFRPCKRCRPGRESLRATHATAVSQACRIIEAAEHAPSLTALAKASGLSPSHFHRVFKAQTGVSPKAYAGECRTQRLRDEMAKQGTVLTAMHRAGFGSAGRLYVASPGALGMTPSAFRAGGEGATIRFAVGQCSLGAVLVAATAKGVCSILLGDDPAALVRDLEDRFRHADLIGGDRKFERWVAKVVALVESPATGLDLPLDIRGTAFQQRVWQALCEIPSGSTANYSQLAKRLGVPTSVRAVANACAANPVAVAIPCHRVVRSDGALAGYRWGIARKRALLARESEQAAR